MNKPISWVELVAKDAHNQSSKWGDNDLLGDLPIPKGKRRKKTGTSMTTTTYKDWDDGGPKCSKTHPTLTLGPGKLLGRSCYDPPADDVLINIGFQSGMQTTWRAMPWHGGIEFTYPIADRKAPGNPKEFKMFVDWVISKLMAGQSIQMGCIGGHGRTGLVIAAIVQQMADNDQLPPDFVDLEMLSKKDAGAWVRKHYCQKAIETDDQIEFLAKHYGIKAITARHSSYSKSSDTDEVIGCVPSSKNIWTGLLTIGSFKK